MKVKVTKKLTNWLVAKSLCVADAVEDVVAEAASKALADGTLPVAEYAELVREEKSESVKRIEQVLVTLAEGQAKLAEAIEKSLQKPVEKPEEKKTEEKPGGDKTVQFEDEDEDDVDATEGKSMPDIAKLLSKGDSKGLFGKARVKGAWEMYDAQTSEAHYPEYTGRGKQVHPLAGKRVSEGIMGRTVGARYVDHPSDLQKAKAGALIKLAINGSHKGGALPRPLRMTDHDWQLVYHAAHEDCWGGLIGASDEDGEGHGATHVQNRKLRQHEIKALIDDAITGGLEAAPIYFDDMFILDPILHSEVFPLVNVVPITRGRRIEATMFGNVTVGWGGGDEDATDLFDTTGYASAFDTSIFVCDGAIELGLDFLSDSPLPVVDIVRNQYNEKLLESLDEQILIGDGIQEPEGVFNQAGIASVNWAGAASVGNVEALLFGVPKRGKKGSDKGRIIFAGTETTYSRIVGLPVGATDARRVFGDAWSGVNSEEDYSLMRHPFAISEALSNTQVAFFNAAHYRLYRRLGLTIKSTGEGRELTRKNLWLVTARSRWGGALERGLYAATTTTAQA